MTASYKPVKLACYASNVTMSIVGNLLPVLFLTFTINESSKAAQIAADMGLTPDRPGMKCGILVGMLFSLVAVFVYLRIMKTQKNFVAVK